MSQYLFFLGRTPEMSCAELKVFFPQIRLVKTDIALLESESDIDLSSMIARLGGTVKIAIFVGSVNELTASELLPFINSKSVKLNFSINSLDNIDIQPVIKQIKVMLAQQNISARFVLPKSGSLSSVVIAKQNVQEYTVYKTENKFQVYETRVVQDFMAWGIRDYDRPFFDPKVGMLPPKVCRMAINIACGTDIKDKKITDPFCGMGTVLSEAIVTGCRELIGVDLSKDSIQKTRANLDWVMKKENISDVKYALIHGDAAHLSQIPEIGSIDAIVTEPYLGSTTTISQQYSPEKIKNLVRGLDKLYVGCLKNWTHVLKKDAKVMIALPSFHGLGRIITVKNTVDTCEKLGYTKLLGPITYGREDARVKREFYLFNKN